MNPMTRRDALAGAAGLTVVAVGPRGAAAAAPESRVRLCLNTSTISGCRGREPRITLPEMVEIAAKAGYDAIEPWIRDIDAFTMAGGKPEDLARRIADLGLTVEDAIGFPEWVVDDEARRARGMEEARRCMDLVTRLGGHRLAAPPAGATNDPISDLGSLTERYRTLLELGDRMGVTPQVEVWGFSRTLSKLNTAAAVAIGADHPRASVLADVYHLHKGGSGFRCVDLLSPEALQVFHLNDYPAAPPPAQITDAHRVYPGEGVAPITTMLAGLLRVGFKGVLSLELFNREYWMQDALTVARTGLGHMKTLLKAARAEAARRT